MSENHMAKAGKGDSWNGVEKHGQKEEINKFEFALFDGTAAKKIFGCGRELEEGMIIIDEDWMQICLLILEQVNSEKSVLYSEEKGQVNRLMV